MRFTADGRRDRSFGRGARVMVRGAFSAIAVAGNGAVLVAGRSIVRLLPDGSRDGAFGAGGRVDLPAYVSDIDVSGGVAHLTGTVREPGDIDARRYAVYARLDARRGALDRSIGLGGLVELPGTVARRIVARPGGGAVVGVSEVDDRGAIRGATVVGIGQDGLPGARPAVTELPSDVRGVAGLDLTPGGGIVVGAFRRVTGGALPILRLRGSGALDVRFGRGGVAAAAGQQDGRDLVVMGDGTVAVAADRTVRLVTVGGRSVGPVLSPIPGWDGRSIVSLLGGRRSRLIAVGTARAETAAGSAGTRVFVSRLRVVRERATARP